jgi:uncharacterized lipoprotein YajG
MKKVFSILALIFVAGCATTPFESATTSGVQISVSFGADASVKDITITTSSDNAQEANTQAKQDATQTTETDATITPGG